MEQCCPNHFLGFCLEDGTPIILVIEGDAQTGWINIETGDFTFGPPPAGTTMCDAPAPVHTPLTCAVDSVTVCPGDDPIIVEQRFLDCLTDSVTVCNPDVTANLSNVAASATNVTLLAANPNRKGAIFFMDGSSIASVKFGATASATSFSIKVASQTYYELNFGYVGIIDAIWTTTTNGFMRITEFV